MTTKTTSTVQDYHTKLDKNSLAICNTLRKEINLALPEATSKLWHGHPVWFINDNPIVGYAKRKDNVRLLFWSGQSFDEPNLHKEGNFKAAEARYTAVDQINTGNLRRWLEKSKTIQWDYKNIVKRRGVLKKLVLNT
mgnify:CR=1 FL=1